MGLFGRAKRVAKLGKRFGECQAKYPEAWAMAEELADETFASRTDYLIEMTKTAEGRDQYIRSFAESLLGAIGEGQFSEVTGQEFPGPITSDALACFGIAFSTRMVDLFEEST